MTKKKITVSIDSDILEKAKKQMPNISEFFNECLKQYFGLVDGIYPTLEASDIIETIGKSQAKLFILNQSIDVHEKMKQIEDEKINRPFRALWNDYRRRLTMNPELTREFMKAVSIDENTLEDVLDYAYSIQDELPVNFGWKVVYEKYLEDEVE